MKKPITAPSRDNIALTSIANIAMMEENMR